MNKQNTEIAKIQQKDLSMVEDNLLNLNQLKLLLKSTPKQYIKQRPAKGGGTWDYVSGSYVRKVLNLMFGWNWDFEILEQLIINGEVVVKGRLTCRVNGHVIIKTQFGNKEIIYKTEKVFNDDGSPKMIIKYGKNVQETRPSEIPLSIGNDLKAAATDSLKKCASEIGIAGDVYGKDDFKEVEVVEDEIYNLEDLKALFELKFDKLTDADRINFARIIDKKEEDKYKFVINTLKSK